MKYLQLIFAIVYVQGTFCAWDTPAEQNLREAVLGNLRKSLTNLSRKESEEVEYRISLDQNIGNDIKSSLSDSSLSEVLTEQINTEEIRDENIIWNWFRMQQIILSVQLKRTRFELDVHKELSKLRSKRRRDRTHPYILSDHNTTTMREKVKNEE
jgi:hypothetical protein